MVAVFALWEDILIPKNLLPEGMHYFIAGGWAACPALATDRDLFVQTTGDLNDTRAMLLDHMRAQGFDVTEEDEHRDFETSDGYSHIPIAKVGKVKQKFNKDIHVLVTSGDVENVLDTFDLSVSQVAITESGRIVKGTHYTDPTQPIYVVKDTPTTPAREEKYRRRFSFPVALEVDGDDLNY